METCSGKGHEKGNEIHDELFENAAVNVSVEEAVELAAEDCNVLAVVLEYNAYGQNVLQQFKDIMRNMANQANSLHVVGCDWESHAYCGCF